MPPRTSAHCRDPLTRRAVAPTVRVLIDKSRRLSLLGGEQLRGSHSSGAVRRFLDRVVFGWATMPVELAGSSRAGEEQTVGQSGGGGVRLNRTGMGVWVGHA
jgi:hypothetical protein